MKTDNEFNFVINVKSELIFESKNTGGSLVIDLETGQLFEINQIAFVLLNSGISVYKIISKISEKYKVDMNIVCEDINKFINKIKVLKWGRAVGSDNDKNELEDMFPTMYEKPCIYEYDMSKGYFSKFISKKSGFEI